MPFSSGRSVRAPASKATRTVRARVPGISTRWIGSPLAREEEDRRHAGMAKATHKTWAAQNCRFSGREKGARYPLPSSMAATERHIRRRADRAAASAPAPTPPARAARSSTSARSPSATTAATSASTASRSRSSPGEFVFLVGASGSGKSTTMRLLIKESEATSGEITVAGRDLSDISRRRVPYYRRNLGVVFQDYKLLPNRTVYETSPTRCRSRAAAAARSARRCPTSCA